METGRETWFMSVTFTIGLSLLCRGRFEEDYWTNTRHEHGPQERHSASATVPTETTTMIDQGDDNDASSNELKL